MRRVSCVSSNRSVKCWLIDRSRQGNGRKDRQLSSEQSRQTQVPQGRSQDPESFCKDPGDGQGRATGSGTSSCLRTRKTSRVQPHYGFVRPTSTIPSQGSLPRDGCLLTPKNKPLGQEQLRKLRDHPAFPWGGEHPKPCLAWGSPLAALAQEGSLPCLLGCGSSQAGLRLSGSGTEAFAKSYFSTQDLISQRAIHPP